MRTVRDMPPACTRDCLVGPSVESLHHRGYTPILQLHAGTEETMLPANTEASAEMNLRLRV